jgi:Zn-dependent protease with chaperone function
MTRAQMVRAKPGLIIRHHAFENFPQGTTPHTSAPLDYLILGLSLLLNPFTARPIDLAGAFVSPLLALLGGWFLWWWSRRMKFRYHWVMLILYAISPVLVHGAWQARSSIVADLAGRDGDLRGMEFTKPATCRHANR